MTNREYAVTRNITVEQLREYQMAYLQCEGYGDDGSEYNTLDEYIAAQPRIAVPAWVSNPEPMHKGDLVAE